MKVALCFWGLTRSLKFTIESIREHILKPLEDNNIEYTIFMHTFSMSSKYYNPRAKEENIQLDFDEHHLLDPDFFKIDDQDVIKEQIQVKKYRSLPDPWNTNYICLDNFICAMYSKKQLGIMVKESNIHFDYIVYLRPDVRYITPLHQRYFNVTHQNTICTPNFHLFPYLNDRLSIITFCNLKTYSEMFDEMYEYSRIYPLHSERFQYNILTRRFRWKVQYIPIHFNRVRADGREEPDTLQYYNKMNQMMEQTGESSEVVNRNTNTREVDRSVPREILSLASSEFNKKTAVCLATHLFSSRDNSHIQQSTKAYVSNHPTSTASNRSQSHTFVKGSPKTNIPAQTTFNLQNYNPQILNEKSPSTNDRAKRPVPKPEILNEKSPSTNDRAKRPGLKQEIPETLICGVNSIKHQAVANASIDKSGNIKRAIQPMFRSRKSTTQSS
jgi:hypothetical protein